MKQPHREGNKGFALIASLLILTLLSVLSIGVTYVGNAETRTYTSDLEGTQTYYASEAAMEKMMVDLNSLYQSQQSPTVSAIQALGSLPPSLPGFSFPEYSFAVPNSGGNPIYTTRTISQGPNQGLIAQILPITLTAAAHHVSGAEIKMVRDIEVAMIPVFQFGTFFDTDLSVFPSPPFTFFGRVHTNGHVFIHTPSTVNLVFRSKVTAAGEVIREYMSNGLQTSSIGWTGPVLVPNAPGGCDGGTASATCRDLDENEGSRLGNVTDAVNPNWNNLSTNIYNGWILNGATGARQLTLPFVSASLRPIEIIKRPPTGESPTSAVGRSRLYNLAQIRILLSDNPADLPAGGGIVRLANVSSVGTGGPDYSAGVPVTGANPTYFAEATTNVVNGANETDWVPNPSAATDWNLLDGYLKIEARQSSGSYVPVTQEWLELGFARGLAVPNTETATANTVHPSAILLLQMQADRNADGDLVDTGESAAITGAGSKNNWFPINLYDEREGEYRDGNTNGTCSVGGIINTLELDVNNLRLWLAGVIGASGTNVESTTQNGYLLYFSDRRGMLPSPVTSNIEGEYGFEDVINPADPAGVPNGVLDPAEDVNENGVLDVYGRVNLGDGFFTLAQGGDTAYDIPSTSNNTYRVGGVTIARKNRVSGARHGLKLVNGSQGNLPTRPGGTGGFAVGSENPVYVQGNYNANNGGFGNPHASASIIADAVITLSRTWSDLNSLVNSTDQNAREADDTWQRMAIASGTNILFDRPAWAPNHWGTDGGVIVFTQYIERWRVGGVKTDHNYMGSMVKLYHSEYHTGLYAGHFYGAPVRNYNFDVDFLDPDKMPPGTPRFQDMVNLGYRQVLDPS